MHKNIMSPYHPNQRLSLKHDLCTVRFIGLINETPCLGVEWDNPLRGKHSGTHNGIKYFTCLSPSPTCASFIPLTKPLRWDEGQSFLSALRAKYEGEGHFAPVRISRSKVVEEVGVEEFAKLEGRLAGSRDLVLDGMGISHAFSGEREKGEVGMLCARVEHLDLSGNLIEGLGEVVKLVDALPKLRSLVLARNRFDVSLGWEGGMCPQVRELELRETFFPVERVWDFVGEVFPNVRVLGLGDNGFVNIKGNGNTQVQTVDFSGNGFRSVSDAIEGVMDPIQVVRLQRNCIAEVREMTPRPLVTELDLRYNDISDWEFFNDIAKVFPNLKHLRTAGNPLYNSLFSAEGAPLAPEDGYMLTISRFPNLETLNYSKVTPKDVLNAEVYYLNQIAKEIALVPPADVGRVKERHPRYSALCAEYGEPVLTLQKPEPTGAAARLIVITFTLGKKVWEEALPRSFDMYEVYGIVGKRLKISPLKLKLVWHMSEKDPIGRDEVHTGPEWWDSSDEEGDSEKAWVRREVELMPSTRPLGTCIDAREASVSVELRTR
ncbi:L domain-like protein, partial [Piedraia hortae CBS 480.64]